VTVYEQLLEVQALDLSLQQLTHRRANLAERAALEVNASQRSGVEAQRGEVDVTHRELVRRQHLLEDEINGVRGRAETHEATLYSGSVNNPRELQALQEDIESLRRRQRVLEDEDLEIMEELEPVVAQLAEFDAQLAALDVAGSELAAALEVAAADIDAEIAGLRTQRDSVADGVANEALADYEQLRDQFGGVGIARLEGNHCGGCHLALSAVEVDRVRKLPGDARVVCEECGRLLVR
jgi:hypothetical protein